MPQIWVTMAPARAITAAAATCSSSGSGKPKVPSRGPLGLMPQLQRGCCSSARKRRRPGAAKTSVRTDSRRTDASAARYSSRTDMLATPAGRQRDATCPSVSSKQPVGRALDTSSVMGRMPSEDRGDDFRCDPHRRPKTGRVGRLAGSRPGRHWIVAVPRRGVSVTGTPGHPGSL